MRHDQEAADVMTTDVLALRPQDSLETAVAALSRRGVSGAPVVDDAGRLVGLLDSSDLLLSEARVHAPSAVEILGAYVPVPGTVRRFEEEVRHALATSVAEAMDDDPPSVGPGAPVADVAALMVSRQVSRVPVTDAGGRVVGVCSRGDLVRAMSR